MNKDYGAMGIDWSEDEDHMQEMEQIFLSLGRKALGLNHYDLVELTAPRNEAPKYNAQNWKAFLQDGRVSEYINSEFEAIQDSEVRKIVINIGDSNSVGKAQILNSLTKRIDDAGGTKSGPAFIYTYIPLDKEQQHAENVEVLEHDPFLKTVSE